MNRICRQYLKQIRLLLPAVKKNEKIYLNHLSGNLTEYCEENHISSLEELYLSYGHPADLVQSYLADADQTYLKHCVTLKKLKKFCLICCILVAISAATTWGSELFFLHKLRSQAQENTILHFYGEGFYENEN